MYSRNRFIIFTGVILCFVCLPPIAAQDDTSRAIASLIKVSEAIDKDNTLDPQVAVPGAWKSISVATRKDPDVLYCYALVRMKHSLESFSILNLIKKHKKDYPYLAKSHIYAAFENKGAYAACNLIKSYVDTALTNKKESEFTYWAVVMIEAIARDNRIRLELRPLLASPAYIAFKQNNNKLNALLNNAGIEFDKQLLNNIRTLQQQIIDAKQSLKKETTRYEKERVALSNKLINNQNILRRDIPNVYINGSVIPVQPNPYYGFVPSFKYKTERRAITTHHWLPQTMTIPFIKMLDFNPPHKLYEAVSIYGKDEYLTAVNGRLRTTIIDGLTHRKNLFQLDLNMGTFLSDFKLKYKDALIDPKLSQDLKTAKLTFQKNSVQFSLIAALNKQQQKQENLHLKFLAEKLLPLIDFSAEKELEKFQAMQP
jgi:hypothetical protein